MGIDKRIWMLSGLLMSHLGAMYASQAGCMQMPGQVVCGQNQQENVDSQGFVQLNGTTVTNLLRVSGVLQADDATLNKITISGTSDLNNTTVRGACHVAGVMTASQSTFKQPVQLTTERANFVQCHLHALKVNSSMKKPVITLTQSSQIQGDITFVGKRGTVKIDASSKLYGKVHNGTIVNISSHTAPGHHA